MDNVRPKHINIKEDTNLLKELSLEVNASLKLLPKARLKILKIKLLVFPALYFAFYIAALIFSYKPALYYFLFFLMGLMVVIIFINLIHELCHGNIFTNPAHNARAYLLFDILGANSFIWQQRHLNLHHRFPNTHSWDSDVEQKGPVLLFPGEKRKKHHRYQHIYVPLLYPFFILNWLLIRDFKDFFSKKSIVRKVMQIPLAEFIKLFFFKLLYLSMLVILPWLVFGISLLQAVAGLLILTISASIFAMTILLPPHANTANSFFRVDDSLEIEESWFKHQIMATNDVSTTNWWTRNLMGNFNYHLAHHLFPQVSHVYAPELTHVVKLFLERHQLPYQTFPLFRALRMHFDLVKRNAFNIKDIDM